MDSRSGRFIPQEMNFYQYPLSIMLVGSQSPSDLLEEERYIFLLQKIKPRFLCCPHRSIFIVPVIYTLYNNSCILIVDFHSIFQTYIFMFVMRYNVH
jgi:hypothetical protein